MPGVGHFRAKHGVAQPDVGGVIFVARFQILPPFNVVPADFVEYKALRKGVQVIFDGVHGYLSSCGGHRVGDLLRRGYIADIVEHESGGTLKHFDVVDAFARYDVLDDYRIVYAVEVLPDIFRPVQFKRVWEGAVVNIVLIQTLRREILSACRGILLEGKRQHLNLDIASRQQRRELAGE